MEINVVLDDEQPQDCIENDTTQCNPVVVDNHGDNLTIVGNEMTEMNVSTL